MRLFYRTLAVAIILCSMAADLSANDVPIKENESVIPDQTDKTDVFENRDYFIETINETLVFDPDIITNIEGLTQVDRSGDQIHFALNGVSIEDLELEQLNELWNQINQVLQGRHLELLQEINRQQSHQRVLREIQETQRTMQQIRNINVNNTPRPPQPPPRPPQMPPRTNR